jgi:SAM-dependent methyltransferase
MNQEILTERYLGKGASDYNKRRNGSKRWQDEHAAVRSYLSRYKGKKVLDIPCGTGRFIPIYKEFKNELIACDISSDMLTECLNEAQENAFDCVSYTEQNATSLASDITADVTVTIRFFNWLSPEDAKEAFINISSASAKAMIVSLSTVDVDEYDAERRENAIKKLEDKRKHVEKAQMLNCVHRLDHFKDWVSSSKHEIIHQTNIVDGKNTQNNIYLLERK